MGVSLTAALVTAVLVLRVLDTDSAPAAPARRRLRGAGRSGRDRSGFLSALGRGLSIGAVEPADEAFVGAASLACAAAAVALGAVAALLSLAATVLAVAARRGARHRDRVLHIERNLPEVIDLLGLVVGAGRPTVSALADISPRVAEPFRSELLAVAKRTGAGEPFIESVRRLREGLGPSVSSVVYATARRSNPLSSGPRTRLTAAGACGPRRQPGGCRCSCCSRWCSASFPPSAC